MNLIKSSLDGLNSLVGGYYAKNRMSIFSKPMVGKTLFLLQEAFWIAKTTGKKVLFIDTEVDKELFINIWADKFEKRFSVKRDRIIIKELRDIYLLLDFHGVKIKVNISKRKGKLTADKVDEVKIEDSEIFKLIGKRRVGTVIYDSVTDPFKKEFGAGTANLPARSSVLGFLYNHIDKLIDKKGVTVITSHHLSKNPTNPSSEETMTGGDSIYYSSKIILQLKGFRSVNLKDYRMLILVRYPDRPKFEDVTYLKYGDEGVVDVSKEEVDELRRS